MAAPSPCRHWTRSRSRRRPRRADSRPPETYGGRRWTPPYRSQWRRRTRLRRRRTTTVPLAVPWTSRSRRCSTPPCQSPCRHRTRPRSRRWTLSPVAVRPQQPFLDTAGQRDDPRTGLAQAHRQRVAGRPPRQPPDSTSSSRPARRRPISSGCLPLPTVVSLAAPADSTISTPPSSTTTPTLV